MTTRFYLDTEFIEDGKTIELISIGMVSSEGHEYYAINRDCHFERADEWVRTNVLAKLPWPWPMATQHDFRGSAMPVLREHLDTPPWSPLSAIKPELLAFIRQHPPPYEFWAYFADYDWVVFCQLFGRMIDLPDGFPMFCCDLKQEMKRQGIRREELPPIANEHDALSDARWVKRCFEGGVGHEWMKGQSR
jgi:hypothetical protein